MKALQVFQNGKDYQTCQDTHQVWRVQEAELDLVFCMVKRLVSNLKDNNSDKLNFKRTFYKSCAFQFLLLLSKNIYIHMDIHTWKDDLLLYYLKKKIRSHDYNAPTVFPLQEIINVNVMIPHFKIKHFTSLKSPEEIPSFPQNISETTQYVQSSV